MKNGAPKQRHNGKKESSLNETHNLAAEPNSDVNSTDQKPVMIAANAHNKPSGDDFLSFLSSLVDSPTKSEGSTPAVNSPDANSPTKDGGSTPAVNNTDICALLQKGLQAFIGRGSGDANHGLQGDASSTGKNPGIDRDHKSGVARSIIIVVVKGCLSE